MQQDPLENWYLYNKTYGVITEEFIFNKKSGPLLLFEWLRFLLQSSVQEYEMPEYIIKMEVESRFVLNLVTLHICPL